jgi:tRNA nucleotidyltransferase (CCA-adding enzyme)
MSDSERIAAAVQAHPALVRALPSMDVPVSLVGGAVRDALLGVDQSEDIDLVVEGDALALAERLGHVLNVRVISHGRFGTAVLELPHERWIDLAMARRERYTHPGALPVVEPGTLVDDLARRDFTVNAMAYRLTGPQAGELVDPLEGRADLEAGVLRALRHDSFVEDPTRLLRAVRYAARLGFSLDAETEAAARASAPDVDITSTRVGDELRRLLCEPTAASAVALAAELGVPWLERDGGALGRRFAAIDASLALPGAPQIPVWALRLGCAAAPDALQRAAVDGWARGIAAEAAAASTLAPRLAGADRRSEVDAILRAAKPATAVVARADGSVAVAEWWATMRDVRLAISGEDLVAAGVAPGPAIGRGLAAARVALLDAEVDGDAAAQLAIACAAAMKTTE